MQIMYKTNNHIPTWYCLEKADKRRSGCIRSSVFYIKEDSKISPLNSRNILQTIEGHTERDLVRFAWIFLIKKIKIKISNFVFFAFEARWRHVKRTKTLPIAFRTHRALLRPLLHFGLGRFEAGGQPLGLLRLVPFAPRVDAAVPRLLVVLLPLAVALRALLLLFRLLSFPLSLIRITSLLLASQPLQVGEQLARLHVHGVIELQRSV